MFMQMKDGVMTYIKSPLIWNVKIDILHLCTKEWFTKGVGNRHADPIFSYMNSFVIFREIYIYVKCILWSTKENPTLHHGASTLKIN